MTYEYSTRWIHSTNTCYALPVKRSWSKNFLFDLYTNHFSSVILLKLISDSICVEDSTPTMLVIVVLQVKQSKSSHKIYHKRTPQRTSLNFLYFFFEIIFLQNIHLFDHHYFFVLFCVFYTERITLIKNHHFHESSFITTTRAIFLSSKSSLSLIVIFVKHVKYICNHCYCTKFYLSFFLYRLDLVTDNNTIQLW